MIGSLSNCFTPFERNRRIVEHKQADCDRSVELTAVIFGQFTSEVIIVLPDVQKNGLSRAKSLENVTDSARFQLLRSPF